MAAPNLRRAAALLLPLLLGCRFEIPARPWDACDGPGCPAADLATGAPGADLATPPDLAPMALDPGRDGAFPVVSFDVTVPIAGLFNDTDTTVIGPGTGNALGPGPFPVVLVSPAVFVPRAEYAAYAQRLASHGLLVVVQTPRNELDLGAYRDNTRRILDWLLSPTGDAAPRVRGRADGARVGLLGHGRGGKVSILVAAADSRVKALLAMDPVDATESTTARGVIGSVRLGGPMLFLGETASKGAGITCPQPNENYETLFSLAPAPAISITLTGASHHDFVADRARCGGGCWACGQGTAPPRDIHELARKYAAAYFLWTLGGDAAAQPYLTGDAFAADAMAGLVTQLTK